MSYPVLYKADATNFLNLGLGILDEAERVHVIEERNGSFYLEMDYPVFGKHFSNLQKSNIIKANAGPELLDQRFRISTISKVSEDWTVTIYAEHVSYMAQDIAMKPTVHIVELNCQNALNFWKNSLIDANPFIVSSDILTTASTVWHIRDVHNPRMALGGVEGSLLDCYGGEYKFDNYHISLLKQRGKRANTMVSYGRNIIDIQQEENIINTYTSIYPYAMYTNDSNKEILVTIDGFTVDSEHVNKYPHRKVIPIDFSSEFEQDEIPTKDKLKKIAENFVRNNNVGVPNVSIKLTYLDLSQTLDYKDEAQNETVNLCDELPVSFELLDIESTAKVVRVVWDELLDRYDNVELGSTRTTLSTVINNIEKQVNQVQTTVNEVQLAANGKNMVFRGPNRPIAQNIGDMWYKPNGEDVELYIWNGLIWEFILSTKPDPKIQEAIDEAKEEAAKAIEDANDAMAQADKAIEESNKAVADANKAVSEAGFAKNQAEQAQSMANNVNSQLPAIKQTAKDALDAYNNMEIGSRNYYRNSDIGFELTSVKDNFTKLIPDDGLLKSLNELQNEEYVISVFVEARKMSSNAAGLNRAGVQIGVVYEDGKQGFFTCLVDSFSNGNIPAKRYYVKAKAENKKIVSIRYTALFSQTVADYVRVERPQIERGNKDSDWHVSPEDVQVQITNINGELSSKVTQTQFNTLQGTVSTQGTQINQNKTDIALKANQSTVNTLTGRVTATESALTVQSGKIEGLVTKTDGQTTEITQLKLTTTGLSSTVSKVQTDLENINVGARNYLKGSNVKVNSGTYFVKSYWLTEEWAEGQIYTLTIKGKVNAGQRFGAWRDGGNMVFGYLAYDSKKDVHTLTAHCPVATNPSNPKNLISIYNVASGTAKSAEIEWAKLEKGTKSTDWSLPPEEQVTQVEFSSLEQTVKGVQVTVAGKAEQSQVTQMAGQISSTVSETSKTKDLSKLSDSLILYKDTTFETSANGVSLYNNSGGTAVTLVRENSPTGTQPTGRPYRLRIKSAGTPTSPGWGGVHQNTKGRQNAQYIHRFIALLPVGREFMAASNFIGDGGTREWLTPTVGTGKWEEYAYITRMGTGEIGTFGHIYVTGGAQPTTVAPLDWYIASMTMYDVSQSNQSQITQLSDQLTLEVNKINSNKADKSQITLLENQINLRVTTSTYNAGMAAKADVTQITLLQNNINLKVSKGDVVAQLNIDAGKTLIQNKSIVLAASTVVFTGSAFIPAASIVSLNADKLTAGTINAANINIINLNASNITSGTINAINIVGSTITGGTITSLKGDYSVTISNGQIIFSETLNAAYGEITPIRHQNKMSVMFQNAKGGVHLNSGEWGSRTASTIELTGFGLGSASRIACWLDYRGSFSVTQMNGSEQKNQLYLSNTGFSIYGNTTVSGTTRIVGNFSVTGSKNAVHVTRSGVRATPAYETAESYLGDIGRAITQESCQVWVPIEELFSDTVNTDIQYEVFLQNYDNAIVWVADFKSDAFLVCSDVPFTRFAWEIKAKRRGYENDRLVLQEDFDNKKIEETFKKSA